MSITLLERELLIVLRAYLRGERSLDDVRQWEVSVSDSSEVTVDEAATIERVALLAETAVAGAIDESAFREAVQDIEERLGADAALMYGP
ncbi:MAG: hypothetical protein OXC56_00160 [Chloroflexi bacterium]|nr:hypothetical protein [Chloroflexota bacterium]